MAETTRKRLGELTRGVFAVLVDLTDPLPVSQVLKLVAERVPPTPFEQEMLPRYPNIRRFDNTIRFATTSQPCRRTTFRNSSPPSSRR